MAVIDRMENLKKLWELYSFKLVLAWGLAVLIGSVSKISFLGGAVLVCMAVFYLIRSFKDPALKKKKTVTRILIYLFLAVFLFAGLIVMSGSQDAASQAIRSQIGNSLVQ